MYDIKLAQKHARRQRQLQAERDEDQEEIRPHYSSNPLIQKFFDDHGDFVRLRDELVFEDGARIESTTYGFGAMKEPPDREYERAKVRYLYFEERCKLADRVFRLYRDGLLGDGETGICIKESTERDQLAKLKALKAAAVKARNRLNKAKGKLDDVTPHWVSAKHRQDAENKSTRNKFRNSVRDMKL